MSFGSPSPTLERVRAPFSRCDSIPPNILKGKKLGKIPRKESCWTTASTDEEIKIYGRES